VVELILTNDVVDFVPYALQLIALLIDQGEAERKRGRAVSSDQYLNFFPFLLNPAFWSRSANVPALVLVFESFVRSFPTVVFGAEYIDQVLGCFQRLIGSKALDVHGFRIANCFLPHIDSVEKLNSRTILLPMLHRQHNSKTYKFTRNFVIFLCRFAAVRGGMSLATTLESIQNGMFVMVMEKIVVGQLKEMPQTTSFDEKRLIVIGISSIIAETVQELMNQSNLYRDLISAGVAILEAYNSAKAPADEEEEFEGNELEYTDPYCKLSYAQHVDSVGQEVTNVKQYLAQAVLARAAQLRPDSTACIETPILQTLQTYLNA
jgi:exportin-2 (importin alpha re-exporter)